MSGMSQVIGGSVGFDFDDLDDLKVSSQPDRCTGRGGVGGMSVNRFDISREDWMNVSFSPACRRIVDRNHLPAERKPVGESCVAQNSRPADAINENASVEAGTTHQKASILAR